MSDAEQKRRADLQHGAAGARRYSPGGSLRDWPGSGIAVASAGTSPEQEGQSAERRGDGGYATESLRRHVWGLSRVSALADGERRSDEESRERIRSSQIACEDYVRKARRAYARAEALSGSRRTQVEWKGVVVRHIPNLEYLVVGVVIVFELFLFGQSLMQ